MWGFHRGATLKGLWAFAQFFLRVSCPSQLTQTRRSAQERQADGGLAERGAGHVAGRRALGSDRGAASWVGCGFGQLPVGPRSGEPSSGGGIVLKLKSLGKPGLKPFAP